MLLSQEMMETLKAIIRDHPIGSDLWNSYHECFLSIYILRFDEMETIRRLSNEVWRENIDNPA